MATRTLALSKIVQDDSIFPRDKVNQDAVLRYRDAYEMNEHLPALIVQKDTNALLDGWHRLAALRELGRESIEVEVHVVPEGVPVLLYAAGLSSRHGVLLSDDSKREVARRVFNDNPDMPATEVAKYLACHERTVRRWVSDLNEQRQKAAAETVELRRSAVVLLTAAGLSQRAVAAIAEVSQQQVIRDGQVSEEYRFRLATDQPHAAAVLAYIPDEHKQAAYAALTELVKGYQDEIRNRREAAKQTEQWRELEHAAQLINQWIKAGKQKPADVPNDRVQFISDALTNGVKALSEGMQRWV